MRASSRAVLKDFLKKVVDLWVFESDYSRSGGGEKKKEKKSMGGT